MMTPEQRSSQISGLAEEALRSRDSRDLACGWLRYEAQRKLSLSQLADLKDRNLRGELWDDMIDELVLEMHEAGRLL